MCFFRQFLNICLQNVVNKMIKKYDDIILKKGEVYMKKILLLVIMFLLASPSFAVVQSAKVSRNNQEQGLTVGVVQKYIHNGMSQDEVALALGSPNIVTQDANGKETWIYDKMSSSITGRDKTESSMEDATAIRYSWHALGTFLTLGLINRGVKPELRDVSQVVSSQNTLTIVVKFDKNNCVESYSYHSSKF